MVRGMVGRGKKKTEKNGGMPPPPPSTTIPSTNSTTTKHAKIQPSFSCSPPIERKEPRAPQPVQASLADHSIGSPPQERRIPKRVPSGKGTSHGGGTGVVKTDLAV
uniref:WH2 domain-containing protein n=1 Tax=Caenorhabditis tropicalis TaxID=1561998 RepID=A0A1I7UJ33_9PELO